MPYTDPIKEAHVSEPGLVVVDVAAADDATALAFASAVALLSDCGRGCGCGCGCATAFPAI
ncbi:DUF6207 family protein [Streptomyces canus]|uniref:DUF6207 family protein n=1 Tax=Streptomyces canus TaxID=58343 RepID=UPI0036E15636